ncbi:MAG: hypothetical protein ACJ8FY_23660 [Gemmataceae bacterium]
MPLRHGLYRTDDKVQKKMSNVPHCLFGLKTVFEAVAFRPPFKSRNLSTSYLGSPEERSTGIARHFSIVLDRLLHSLDIIQRTIAKRQDNFDHEGTDWTPWIQTEIAADSVLTYLGILVDDIGKLVPLVFDNERLNNKGEPILDSFSKLKDEVINQSFFTPLLTLFQELDRAQSWWKLGIERRQGIRQRLVHYSDLVNFQVEKADQEKNWRVKGYLVEASNGVAKVDFLEALRRVLHGLFDWLDRLEQALTNQLISRSQAENVAWSPSKECPLVWLPIEKPFKEKKIPDSNFLYLPVCSGSAPIGCKVHFSKGRDNR